jgi:hypothetical protein
LWCCSLPDLITQLESTCRVSRDTLYCDAEIWPAGPLIIIRFDYFSGLSKNASPGTLFIREDGLVYPLTERLRAAFGDSSAFRSSWTFIGVAVFLVWGIPMSITIAGIFAKAWRREQFGLSQRLLQGATGSSCT